MTLASGAESSRGKHVKKDENKSAGHFSLSRNSIIF